LYKQQFAEFTGRVKFIYAPEYIAIVSPPVSLPSQYPTRFQETKRTLSELVERTLGGINGTLKREMRIIREMITTGGHFLKDQRFYSVSVKFIAAIYPFTRASLFRKRNHLENVIICMAGLVSSRFIATRSRVSYA